MTLEEKLANGSLNEEIQQMFPQPKRQEKTESIATIVNSIVIRKAIKKSHQLKYSIKKIILNYIYRRASFTFVFSSQQM